MKLFPRSQNVRRIVIIGLSVPMLLMVLVGFLQWQAIHNFRNARDWVAHTQKIRLNLETFLSSMTDAETGQRGYLLTHRETYLGPYLEAQVDAPERLRMLRDLMANNEDQMTDLDDLEMLMRDEFQELDQTISLVRAGDPAGALKIIETDTGKNTMDQIRGVIEELRINETDLLREREADYEAITAIDSWLSVIAIVLGLCFMVAIFMLLRRIESLQSMVKICAWSKMIEYKGEWLTIEEYLTRGLHMRVTHGLSKTEAERMLKVLDEEKPKKAA